MKTNQFFQITLLMLFLSVFCASAQQFPPENFRPRPEGMPGPRERMTPKEKAAHRTDEMDRVVNLDEKQYKKIYKIYLKEENAKANAMENGFPMGPPPGGFPGGFPGGGFPGGGFPGGGFSEGGFPGGGFPGSGFPGEMPKPAVGGKEIDSDEYTDARDAKFKKILTPEQYARLSEISRAKFVAQ